MTPKEEKKLDKIGDVVYKALIDYSIWLFKDGRAIDENFYNHYTTNHGTVDRFLEEKGKKIYKKMEKLVK
jgi:hypothetical protein